MDNMAVTNYIKKCLIWYNNLKPNQKKMISILVLVVFINLFNTHIYRRQARKRRLLGREVSSLDHRLKELTSQFPDLDEEKEVILEQKKQLSKIFQRLRDLEKEFPTQARVPKLLSDLIEYGKGKIEFISIIPKASGKKELYSHLDIELTVRCSYKDLSEYIFSLEKLPEFLVVSSLELKKKKEEEGEYVESKILLSTLLTGDTAKPKKVASSGSLKQPVIVKDPFISENLTDQVGQSETALKLGGIVFRKEKSSVIINGDVYKTGDRVGDKIITQILKDRVIVKDKDTAYQLNLEN